MIKVLSFTNVKRPASVVNNHIPAGHWRGPGNWRSKLIDSVNFQLVPVRFSSQFQNRCLQCRSDDSRVVQVQAVADELATHRSYAGLVPANGSEW